MAGEVASVRDRTQLEREREDVLDIAVAAGGSAHRARFTQRPSCLALEPRKVSMLASSISPVSRGRLGRCLGDLAEVTLLHLALGSQPFRITPVFGIEECAGRSFSRRRRCP